jgi:molybdopterin synthase sulfur carrier subunit
MNVRVYATLRPIVGGKEASLTTGAGDTFRQMIDEMLVRWPALERELFDAKGELRTNIHIFLNGRDVRYLGGLEMTIPEHADVCVFPTVGGGR